MDQKLRKVIYMSLAGTLLGVLLFVFGITISHNTLLVDCVYYILGVALMFISFLSLKNNYKTFKKPLLIYIMLIDLFFIILATIYMVINHF